MNLPQPFDPEAPVFTVTVAAALAEMHPQTLRGYDRLGLVVPQRSRGRGRRYSLRDIHRLRHVQYLSQSEGINLEGIRRVLALEAEVELLQAQVARLSESLQRVADEPPPRVFTADAHGGVHPGRRRTPRAQLTRR